MSNILLGVTGSVAATLTDKLFGELQKLGEVKIVATQAGRHFIQRDALPTICPLYYDEDEWNSWRKMGDPILHIELRRWADVFVIAPLDANTLAKMAGGYADNLLTSVFRAWDHSKFIVAAPAMNTVMWNNWPTQPQLDLLHKAFPNFNVLDPVEKHLACDDVGMGAMTPINNIIGAVTRALLPDVKELGVQSWTNHRKLRTLA